MNSFADRCIIWSFFFLGKLDRLYCYLFALEISGEYFSKLPFGVGLQIREWTIAVDIEDSEIESKPSH